MSTVLRLYIARLVVRLLVLCLCLPSSLPRWDGWFGLVVCHCIARLAAVTKVSAPGMILKALRIDCSRTSVHPRPQ